MAASRAFDINGRMSGESAEPAPMAASISPDSSMVARSLLSARTTFAGATYSSTCSSPDNTQVTLFRSTPYTAFRMPLTHTPVVTVYPRTPTLRPSKSRGDCMPDLVLYTMEPW